MELLKSLEVKHDYTTDEKLALMDEITEAYDIIAEKNITLEILKENIKQIKEQVDEQVAVVSSIVAKYKAGGETKMCQCSVTYEKGEATFIDAETGEIVLQRGITSEEQLSITEKRTDAETIIRQARKEED